MHQPTISSELDRAELDMLISQNLALTDALNIADSPMTATRSAFPFPTKPVSVPRKSVTRPSISKRTKFSIVNGSKLHSLTKKEAPYPLSYDKAVLDSDVYDGLYFRKIYGLTLHNFGDTPPTSVLDIGTGNGSWIIEAASEWKNASLLVGFDLVDIQPNPAMIEGPFEPIKNRVRWVHGNLLERLPFTTDQFDFVRISRIALGVPENKWNQVLEEAVRVLKPGGALEVLEEDLLFPFNPRSDDGPSPSDPLNAGESSANNPSLNGDHVSVSGSSAAPSSIDISLPPSRRPLSINIPLSRGSRSRSRSLGSNARGAGSSPSSGSPMQSTPPYTAGIHGYLQSQPGAREVLLRMDPRDHSILHHAWNAMLDDRFTTSKPTSLLPFYLSMHLQNIRSHQPIHIVAPPPSYCSASPTSSPTSISFKEDTPLNLELSIIDAAPFAGAKNHQSGIFINSNAGMHLRRSLQLVLGCQEALWEQASKLYPSLGRTRFEDLLHDFELDMLDRIDARTTLKYMMGWTARDDTSQLLWWRDKVGNMVRDEGAEAPLICRTIRAFVGLKPLT